MATVQMELDRDYNINGVQYNKGEDVEVQKEHVDAINEIKEANDKHLEWANTHHGAVPSEDATESEVSEDQSVGDDQEQV